MGLTVKTETMKLNSNTKKLIELYDLFPFHNHPLWKGVLKNELSRDQVLLAEGQHYLRTMAGQILRKEALEKCLNLSDEMYEALKETYEEECTEIDGTPTHLDLIKRFLTHGGYSIEILNQLKNTPGNAAAIALYRNISDRGVGCHIIGAGVVEYFYSELSPKIFNSYTTRYGFSEFAAETYKIHGTMDQLHAERAFDVVDTAINMYGWDIIEGSVRDAFVATSLHYDGMLQAATGEFNYWNGKK